MANVMAQIFEEQGFTAELVPAESASRYEAVRIGDLHVAHETWESTMALPFYEAMDKGGLIDAGSHDLITFEEMGIPNWVIDEGLCPGLPSWEALKSPECAANFATADSGGKGRWLEGPYEWHTDVMPNRLKGLGLDDKWMVKFAGSADALWAELAAAKKEGRGTVIFNWSPNFTDAAGFTFIDFPPYFEGCRLENGGTLETNGNDIHFADGDKAFFGTHQDLQIRHNGTNSQIQDAGTGDLIFKSNGTDVKIIGDNVKIKVELITPIAMEEGLKFAIREGGKTVGAGVVAKITE